MSGRPAGRAYEEAGYRQRGDRADTEAYKLQQRPEIEAYMAEIRAKATKEAEVDLAKVMKYLGTAIFTPVGEIDESHPLAQEVVHEDMPNGGRRTKIKMVGKIESAKLLAALAGWMAPKKHEVAGDPKLLEILGKARTT